MFLAVCPFTDQLEPAPNYTAPETNLERQPPTTNHQLPASVRFARVAWLTNSLSMAAEEEGGTTPPRFAAGRGLGP